MFQRIRSGVSKKIFMCDGVQEELTYIILAIF